jgi:hypothetical protein
MRRLRLLTLFVAFLTLASAPLVADLLPIHALPTHLDPFATPGAVAMGPPFGEVLAPFTPGTPQVGADGLNSAEPWHWETEIDVVNFAGPTNVWINFGLPGQLGPFPAIFGPGWDIIVDLHQPDQAGSFVGQGLLPVLNIIGATCLGGGAEVGGVCKQFINATKYIVAYSVAVQEGPRNADIILPAADFPKVWDAEDGPGTVLTLTESGGDFFLTKTLIPEPTTYVMFGSGLLVFLLLASRRLRRAD